MEFTVVSPTATIPQRTSVGYDIFSSEGYAVMPGERVVVSTGVTAKLPDGHYGVFHPKTGIMIKHGVTVAGTLDPDYTGELKVVVFNHDRKNTFVIRPGYRVASLVVGPMQTGTAPDN